jgi:hypothetical protein
MSTGPVAQAQAQAIVVALNARTSSGVARGRNWMLV